jgi:hypothetical protein
VIDPCNKGPNLITEEAMLYVGGQLSGPGTIIRAYDGGETMTGGEVQICFSAPGGGNGLKKRYYTEKFHCVPHISDGIDMILNYNFYMRHYKDKVPGVLMIRTVKRETKGKILLRFRFRSINCTCWRLTCVKNRNGNEKSARKSKTRKRENKQQRVAKKSEQPKKVGELSRQGTTTRIIPHKATADPPAPITTARMVIDGRRWLFICSSE